MAALFGLFAAALLAATLLPAQSEALLFALTLQKTQPVALLIAVATLGNVAGSAVNWGFGRHLTRYRDRRWFPVRPAALARAERVFARWGAWSLLLSWVPVIGDPLTLVAGLLRLPFSLFLAVVTLAKLGRYLVVAWAAMAM